MIDAAEVKERGRELGIDVLRITGIEPFTIARQRHIEQLNSGLRANHSDDLQSFYAPGSKVPGARSIIGAAQCYLIDEEIGDPEPGRPQGLIARYTWRNYYQDLKHRLKKLAQSIPGHESYCLSNGPVAEKPIAQRSGIGHYGKHSIIVNPKFGSWIVLGEIITTLELEPDTPLTNDCGQCKICIQRCPTRAITRPYVIDRTRCIQALTNWPGIIPDDIARAWGNRLYGCTSCQESCPVNTEVRPRKPHTDIGHVGSSYSVVDLLRMTEKQYRRQFADNQMSAAWIDFTAIQRNALLVLGNSHDEATLPLIIEYTKNPDPRLQHTARWALDQFK